RDEEAGIDRALGRHECVREEEEVDERAELEEPEEDREVLDHRRVASRAYMHSRTSALCQAGLSPYLALPLCLRAASATDVSPRTMLSTSATRRFAVYRCTSSGTSAIAIHPSAAFRPRSSGWRQPEGERCRLLQGSRPSPLPALSGRGYRPPALPSGEANAVGLCAVLSAVCASQGP